MPHNLATTSPAPTEAAAPQRPIIAVRNLRKTFGEFVAVKDFSLEINRGEVVSLLGPSGCGKTTTLRCIAGLENPDSGEIEINGRLVFSSRQNIQLPPEKRGLSMVFQQYALWPHMTVMENVAFPLEMRRLKRELINQRAEAALRKVRLWERGGRKISELSGGQQQRVALARAIAVEPDIILFDEPLSNLDAKLREDLRLELQQLQRELGFSAIYVTHDQDEAISLSSRIVIMNGGICEQEGPPPVIWRDPATRFVARFIGSKNSLKGRVVSRQEGTVRVETEAGPVIECGVSHIPPEAEAVELFIGSGEIDLLPQPSGAANSFPGEVSLVSFQGESTLYEVRFGSKKLAVRCPGEARYSEGQRVGIRVPPASVHGYALEVD